jgi:rhamnosyl/mannosyltransferase
VQDTLRILHSYKVYRPDIDGGIPFAIAALSRPADGLENRILVARRRGKGRRYLWDGVSVEGVSCFGTFFSTPLAPAYPLTLLRRVRSADILVHHAPFPLVDAISNFLPDDLALIVYWHADIVGYAWLKSLVTPAIERTLQRANRIVVSDRSVLENSPVLTSFAEKCAIAPYGIDVDFWSMPNAAERSTASRLRQSCPRMILTIGRIVSYKGLDILFHAMKELDAGLVVIGEGPLESDLKRLAEKLAITDRVVFRGRLSASEIKSHLHAARVLAFPSVTCAEAFGIVQLEAMAAGLPVVNTALPTAVPNIARHDKEGLTVPPNDAHALAVAIDRLLEDPMLANRLGTAGRIRAQTEYSNDRFLSRMKAIYDEVIQSCPQSAQTDSSHDIRV